MAQERQTIERLEELRDSFDPRSDEYADVSQTIHYLKEAEARNDG
jgi:hypothetical protein